MREGRGVGGGDGGNTDEGGMPECPTGSSSRIEKRCGRRWIFEFMRASHAYISPLSKKKKKEKGQLEKQKVTYQSSSHNNETLG